MEARLGKNKSNQLFKKNLFSAHLEYLTCSQIYNSILLNFHSSLKMHEQIPLKHHPNCYLLNGSKFCLSRGDEEVNCKIYPSPPPPPKKK